MDVDDVCFGDVFFQFVFGQCFGVCFDLVVVGGVEYFYGGLVDFFQ